MKNKIDSGIISTCDNRARKCPPNKIPVNITTKITEFLSIFPKYKSHYSENTEVYFSPCLYKQKLYNLFCENNPDMKISNRSFTKLLETFNVSLYQHKKDTCSMCSSGKSKNKSNTFNQEYEKDFGIYNCTATFAKKKFEKFRKTSQKSRK